MWRCFTCKTSSWSHCVTPRGGWPILMLRGVSQPTPNAPEVPRAVGVCLDISNAHVPRYFHIFISFALRMFVKTPYKSKFGPKGMYTQFYMPTWNYPSTKKQPNRPPGSQFTALVQFLRHPATWRKLPPTSGPEVGGLQAVSSA